MRRGRV